jgi:hypothetical protein
LEASREGRKRDNYFIILLISLILKMRTPKEYLASPSNNPVGPTAGPKTFISLSELGEETRIGGWWVYETSLEKWCFIFEVEGSCAKESVTLNCYPEVTVLAGEAIQGVSSSKAWGVACHKKFEHDLEDLRDN